eukprot:g5006.t1
MFPAGRGAPLAAGPESAHSHACPPLVPEQNNCSDRGESRSSGFCVELKLTAGNIAKFLEEPLAALCRRGHLLAPLPLPARRTLNPAAPPFVPGATAASPICSYFSCTIPGPPPPVPRPLNPNAPAFVPAEEIDAGPSVSHACRSRSQSSQKGILGADEELEGVVFDKVADGDLLDNFQACTTEAAPPPNPSARPLHHPGRDLSPAGRDPADAEVWEIINSSLNNNPGSISRVSDKTTEDKTVPNVLENAEQDHDTVLGKEVVEKSQKLSEHGGEVAASTSVVASKETTAAGASAVFCPLKRKRGDAWWNIKDEEWKHSDGWTTKHNNEPEENEDDGARWEWIWDDGEGDWDWKWKTRKQQDETIGGNSTSDEARKKNDDEVWISACGSCCVLVLVDFDFVGGVGKRPENRNSDLHLDKKKPPLGGDSTISIFVIFFLFVVGTRCRKNICG